MKHDPRHARSSVERRPRTQAAGWVLVLICGLGPFEFHCRGPESTQVVGSKPSSDDLAASPEDHAAPEGGPAPRNGFPDRDQVLEWKRALESETEPGWLEVMRIDAGAIGGWAAGRFDEKSNKIEVETHEVRSFVIQADRLPVDWRRLVVIRINGRNGELRRRPTDVYWFERNDRGIWVIREPE